MITKTQPNQNRPWKKLLLTLSVACSLTLPMEASLPSTASTNLTVLNGSATTSVAGSTLTVNAADKTVLSWVNFWDGQANGGTSALGDVINYQLPASTSAILNSVTGGFLTTVNGEITSNGKVFILNPAGITIGSTGVINAASFGASAVPETLSYFESNGTLAAFNGLSGGTAGKTVSVNSGASLSTLNGSGTIYLAGPNVNLDANVTGNASLYGSLSGGTVNVGDAATVTITTTPTGTNTTTGGNLLIVGVPGSTANLGDGFATTIQGNLTATTNGGAINLTNGANVTTQGNTVIDTSGSSNGNIGQGAGTYYGQTTGSTTTLNTATETTAGTISTASPSTSPAAGTITLTSEDVASLTLTGGNTSISDPTANTLQLGTVNVNGTYSATSVGGNIATSGTVAVTGAISLATQAAGKTINFTGSGNLVFSSLTTSGAATGGAITISSSGNITIPGGAGLVTPSLSVTSTAGNLFESGSGITVTKAVLSATTGGIYFDKYTNGISNVSLTGAPKGVYLANGSALTVLGGTSTTGAVQLTQNGNLAFGATSGDSIVIGGNLGVDVSGGAAGANTVTTPAGTFSVSGNVGLYGNADNITLGLAGSTAATFGQISAAGVNALTINESQTTNLGGSFTFLGSNSTANGPTTSTGYAPVTTYGAGLTQTGVTLTAATGSLAIVSGGNIINPTGVITVPTTTSVTAGSTSAPGSIQLGTTTSPAVLTGTITDARSNGLTLVNAAATTVNTTGANITGALSATVQGAGNALAVTFGGTGGFTSESFSTNGGNVSIATNPVSTTVTNATMTAGTQTVTLTDTGSITFGSGVSFLNSNGATTANTFTAAGIFDSANSPYFFYGATTFASSGNIVLNTNVGNNVGQVTLNLTAAAGVNTSIDYAEGGTVNLAGITVSNATDTGHVAITSNTGDVIQANALGLGANTKLSGISFTAPAGSVVLGNVANAFGSMVPVALSEKGTTAASVLYSTQSLLLGNVTDSGAGLTVASNTTGGVITTAAGTGSISQASGTTAFVYGNPTFYAGTGGISVTNSGNNFGAITANSTGAVSMKEYGTNNYAGVSAGAGFTAVDESSNIIEKAGAVISVTGATSLTATNGAVVLTNTTNTFGGTSGILLKTAGNAYITDAATSTILTDGTNVAGALALTNTSAGGLIGDGGSTATITVTGAATFTATNAGSVNFLGNNSSFGGLTFVLGSAANPGSAASTFTENATTNLLSGSTVYGAMTINSGGNIITTAGTPVTVVSGNVSTTTTPTATFKSTLRLNANGSIVLNPAINVTGQLTVDAVAGPTDLSAESLSGNLNSPPTAAPINLGNQTNYTPPKS